MWFGLQWILASEISLLFARPELRGFVGRIALRVREFKRGLIVAEMMVSIELNFKDDSAAERQEKLTQGLWQELKAVPGLKVDRVAEIAPDGSRGLGRFLWGLLQADVSVSSLKTLFGFLGDRLGDKPIEIKAKFADGRVFQVTASSIAELAAAREAIEAMAKIE